MCLFSLSALFFACDSTEDPVAQQPILGVWSEVGDGVFKLTLNNEEVTLEEFGVTVFGYNEETAEDEARTYLYDNVMGPLRLDADLEIKSNNSFAVLSDETIEGSWQLYNDGARLRLQAQGFALEQYEFDVVTLTCTQLKLKFEATIEVIGTDLTYDYKVEIDLVKPGCL